MTSGTSEQYVSFDEATVSATLQAARQPFEGTDLRAVAGVPTADSGETELRAQCLEVTSGNKRVCLNLPLGLGKTCIPLPFDLPDGSAVRACLSIRTGPFGIPTGVCVRLFVAGEQIVKKCLP